jgi:hypothetical protein
MTEKSGRVDIIKEIEVHGVLPEGENQIYMVHTHGMEEYGFPNLLIESSEIFIYVATSLLNSVCDWLVNDVKIENINKAKQEPIALTGLPNMKFEETDYEDQRVWKLIPLENVVCSCCSELKPEGVTEH